MNKQILAFVVLVFTLCLACIATRCFFGTNKEVFGDFIESFSSTATANYIVTEHSVDEDESCHFVTMQEENKNQQVVFELTETEYNNSDFSEGSVLSLDLKKTGERTKYFLEGERLMTKEDMDRLVKTVFIAILVVAVAILLIIAISSPENVILEVVEAITDVLFD